MRWLLLLLPFSLSVPCQQGFHTNFVGKVLANWNFSTAEGVKASLTIDKTDVTTNDEVNLLFSINLTPDLSLDETKLNRDFLIWLEQQQIELIATKREERGKQTRFLYTLRFSKPGTQAILFPNPSIGNYTLEPELLTVTVRLPSSPDFTAPGEIAKPLSLFPEGLQSLSEENREKLQSNQADDQARYALAKRQLPLKVVGLLLILLLAVYLIQRYRTTIQSASPPEPVSIDPHIKALTALEQLKAENLPDRQLWDLFYSRLTGIIRDFMDDQFGLKAPEQTTEEFLHDLVHSQVLPKPTQSKLKAFLSEADLVKFAKATSDANQCNCSLAAAHQIVTVSNSSGESDSPQNRHIECREE